MTCAPLIFAEAAKALAETGREVDGGFSVLSEAVDTVSSSPPPAFSSGAGGAFTEVSKAKRRIVHFTEVSVDSTAFVGTCTKLRHTPTFLGCRNWGWIDAQRQRRSTSRWGQNTRRRPTISYVVVLVIIHEE